MQFNRHELTILQARISRERLGPYLTATSGDVRAAVQLYDWNIAASAALSADLQRLEVVVRNCIHDQLSAHYGPWWFDTPGLLKGRRCEEVVAARSRIAPDKEVTPGRIVAELTFGFWVFLLDGRYEHALWIRAIRHGFPGLTSENRRELKEPVRHLHRLRNRIAHCEPVIDRNIAADEQAILTVAGYVSPVVADWIHASSLVAGVRQQRPHSPTRRGKRQRKSPNS